MNNPKIVNNFVPFENRLTVPNVYDDLSDINEVFEKIDYLITGTRSVATYRPSKDTNGIEIYSKEILGDEIVNWHFFHFLSSETGMPMTHLHKLIQQRVKEARDRINGD